MKYRDPTPTKHSKHHSAIKPVPLFKKPIRPIIDPTLRIIHTAAVCKYKWENVLKLFIKSLAEIRFIWQNRHYFFSN